MFITAARARLKLPRLAELCAYLGCQIFESSPGRGLAPWPSLENCKGPQGDCRVAEAFLVVTGSVRDYPIDLVGFMRTTNLSHLQIGTFLGEDGQARII